jgi:flagellar basal-body rod protein FlgB
MKFLFNDINYDKAYLDFLKIKDHVIVSNLANAETPFYHRLKAVLIKAENEIPLKTTNFHHITNTPQKPFEYKIIWDKSELSGFDKNNVDVEKEMVELEKVALKYETVMKFIQGKISDLDLVIKGTSGG